MKALLIAVMMLTTAPAWAQEEALRDLPGYVDFGELGSLFGEPTVQIAVGASLLKLIGAVTASEDPQAAALFERLKGVRVNVFENPGPVAGAVDYVRDASARLSAAGWESVVSVNSPDEQVRIFMKMNAGAVEGITVMAVESGEAAFINVIGSLNPAELGKVMDNFDIDLGGGPESTDTP